MALSDERRLACADGSSVVALACYGAVLGASRSVAMTALTAVKLQVPVPATVPAGAGADAAESVSPVSAVPAAPDGEKGPARGPFVATHR